MNISLLTFFSFFSLRFSNSPFLLCAAFFCSVSPPYIDKGWRGTPINELNRMPQCAPPLSHLKVVPNHTIAVRVSQHQLILCDWALCDGTTLGKLAERM